MFVSYYPFVRSALHAYSHPGPEVIVGTIGPTPLHPYKSEGNRKVTRSPNINLIECDLDRPIPRVEPSLKSGRVRHVEAALRQWGSQIEVYGVRAVKIDGGLCTFGTYNPCTLFQETQNIGFIGHRYLPFDYCYSIRFCGMNKISSAMADEMDAEAAAHNKI